MPQPCAHPSSDFGVLRGFWLLPVPVYSPDLLAIVPGYLFICGLPGAALLPALIGIFAWLQIAVFVSLPHLLGSRRRFGGKWGYRYMGLQMYGAADVWGWKHMGLQTWGANTWGVNARGARAQGCKCIGVANI